VINVSSAEVTLELETETPNWLCKLHKCRERTHYSSRSHLCHLLLSF